MFWHWRRENEQARGYATRLATILAEKHWPENKEWRPLPTLIGVLTQIDNMTTGLVRKGTEAE